MKYSGFKVVCLLLVACTALFSAFGDEITQNLESRIVESFDDDSEYEWRLTASKFATKSDEETFPKIASVDAWPEAVFGSNPENEDGTLKSLGIWGRFDRRGFNWVDVYPVVRGADENATPSELPLPGRVKNIDLWVWSGNFDYYVEAYVRDYLGIVHIIDMGTLDFEGWKNLLAPIPNVIPQGKRQLPKLESLQFIKFRIWTQPTERVDNFYIYLDHFKVLTDTFESLFDGDDLIDPVRMQEIWGTGDSAAGNAN
jgi:hypothetical protein